MPYRYYYQNLPYNPQIGSRSRAKIYPGAFCPLECNFGRVHGSSAAVGEITVKGTVVLPPAFEAQINIGSSDFFGIVTKIDTDISLSSGNQTKIRLIDYRDRLLDVNHFAQYNMVDSEGTWWHIMPEDWEFQRRSMVHDMQGFEDFTKTQELPDYSLNLIEGDKPMFSLFSIMSYFAELYDFTLSAEPEVEDKMMRYYPENLDWNTGKRVGECIDEMLAKSNMQWTAWGNLHVHVTEKGVPESQLERDLLAGNLNVCDIGNFKEGAIGQELNDKSRRIRVVGGRNKHEFYFPAYPDWNPKWTGGMIFNNWDMSSFLQKHNLSRLDDYSALPDEYKDYEEILLGVPYILSQTKGIQQDVVRKFNGKSRNLMTIGEYLDQIPFKSYRIDFSRPLYPIPLAVRADGSFVFDNPDQANNFRPVGVDGNGIPNIAYGWVSYKDDDFSPESQFDFEYWLDRLRGWSQSLDAFSTDGVSRAYFESQYNTNTPPGGPGSGGPRDSRLPISQSMVTDSNLQFLVSSTVRSFNNESQRSADQFMNGRFAFITEGVSLDIEDYIFTVSPKPPKLEDYVSFMGVNISAAQEARNNDLDSYNFYRRIHSEGLDQYHYTVRVVFNERMFDGVIREKVPVWIVGVNDEELKAQEGKPPETEYVFSPAQVYVRISLDAQMYSIVLGEAPTAPRVREKVISMSDLHESRVYGNEVAMLAQNIISQGLINNVTADLIAAQVAQRALNHEYITTSGHLTLRTQAGFMCSGIIDSVRVQFSPQSGVQETINFTNIRNDERVPSYFSLQARNIGASALSEKEIAKRELQEKARALVKKFNGKGNQNGGFAVKDSMDYAPTIERGTKEFGKDGQVMLAVGKGAEYPDILDGEIVLFRESPFKVALNNAEPDEEET